PCESALIRSVTGAARARLLASRLVRRLPAHRDSICAGNADGSLAEAMREEYRAIVKAGFVLHEHEWQVFKQFKRRLADKVLIPGVLASCSNYIEHPELVAERIVRYAKVVGRENVLAGTDCGFATIAGFAAVEPHIAWAKFRAMADGAQLASRRLWQTRQ
ncbi:MAG: hypothetical protein ACREXT_01620, partial [Gammaproteobacteria bacterium]